MRAGSLVPLCLAAALAFGAAGRAAAQPFLPPYAYPLRPPPILPGPPPYPPVVIEPDDAMEFGEPERPRGIRRSAQHRSPPRPERRAAPAPHKYAPPPAALAPRPASTKGAAAPYRQAPAQGAAAFPPAAPQSAPASPTPANRLVIPALPKPPAPPAEAPAPLASSTARDQPKALGAIKNQSGRKLNLDR